MDHYDPSLSLGLSSLNFLLEDLSLALTPFFPIWLPVSSPVAAEKA